MDMNRCVLDQAERFASEPEYSSRPGTQSIGAGRQRLVVSSQADHRSPASSGDPQVLAISVHVPFPKPGRPDRARVVALMSRVDDYQFA